MNIFNTYNGVRIFYLKISTPAQNFCSYMLQQDNRKTWLQEWAWRKPNDCTQVSLLFKLQTAWGKKGLLHLCSKGDKHDGVPAPDKCLKVLKQYK